MKLLKTLKGKTGELMFIRDFEKLQNILKLQNISKARHMFRTVHNLRKDPQTPTLSPLVDLEVLCKQQLKAKTKM